nr:axonemal coiled-coil protein ODA10 [Chlamydomonas reinhardtii]
MAAQLQERLAQLEADTQASQDQAQWTIKQNKNTLLALKQENKDLSAEVSRRGGSNELQCKSGSATDGGKVVERLERQVHELRRGHDKIAKDKKTALQKLDNLHDSLRDLAKVAAGAAPSPSGSGAHSHSYSHAVPVNASTASSASAATMAAISAAAAALPANSPAARELRQLQNRLDKATVKADEAYSIRKTYEQVLEKLRVEEPLLEARIRGLQEQRATKQSAMQAAALSGREAHAAKEAAKQQLAALAEELAAGRARRGRVLAEMREKAATLQQTNRTLMQRQFQPLVTSSSEAAAHPDSAAASPAGKPSAAPTDPTNPTAAEEADALHASSLSTATAAAVERGEGDDITARDLVVRLCRATGARRVSELLARLLTQQESYANLVSMRSAATTQRLALVQELEVLRSHREELRGGGKMSTQRQLDAAQEELREAAARADAAASSLEGLLKGWADVRSGLEHLAALVAPLPLPAGGQPAVPVEDETLGDVLAQIESRLHNAYKLIATLPKAAELLEANYAALRADTGA